MKVDKGNNQGNELQLEAVENSTRANQDGEPAGKSFHQAAVYKETMMVKEEEVTGSKNSSEQSFGNVSKALEISTEHVSQLEKEPNRVEVIQEEMASFLGTSDLALPTTSKECRDLLDFMFPDFPTEETKHTIKFDEDVFPLPALAMEDKLPPPPRTSITSWAL